MSPHFPSKFKPFFYGALTDSEIMGTQWMSSYIRHPVPFRSATHLRVSSGQQGGRSWHPQVKMDSLTVGFTSHLFSSLGEGSVHLSIMK